MNIDLTSALLGLSCGLAVAGGVWLSARSQQGAQLDRFKAISQEALKANAETLMAQLSTVTERAKGDLNVKEQAFRELVKPISEKLAELDKSQHALNQQLTNLDQETTQLVQALRRPQVRGAWGEMQLKRVVELAGMLNHCDFVEQQTQGNGLRPDMLVNLPGGKTIIVDAKTPLEGYLNAMGREGPEREAAMAQHVKHIRSHITQLGSKNYWNQFAATPEFVVLFIPGENFYAAALEADPALLEAGAAENVVVATPTTLIALLRAVNQGWQQENLSKNVAEIKALGRDLYDRIEVVGRNFAKLGTALGNVNDAYNTTLTSIENRLLVTARKLKDTKALGTDTALPELVEPKLLEASPKPPSKALGEQVES